MFHISRAFVFIACLAAAVFVDWRVGLIGLIASIFIIPRDQYPLRKIKSLAEPIKPIGGTK